MIRYLIRSFCKGIPDSDFPHHLLTRVGSVEEGIKLGLERSGQDSTISVIRDAPYVIPKVIRAL